MKNKDTYTIINASAGSGKTYALVQRILMICLSEEKKHEIIRHILALTFTNKAANEMKSRILEWLQSFTREDYLKNEHLIHIQRTFLETGIPIAMDELHRRAQKVLDYILHNYSTLNIGTIDKFNAKLVRSFSYELGLPHQFNLEIQSEPYLIEAVDKMLDEIGENPLISEAFMDYVNYNLENDEQISINKTLYKTSKQFVNDIHYEELKNNRDFDWSAYQKTKSALRKDIRKLKQQSKSIALEALDKIRSRNLEHADFYGRRDQSIIYFFESFLKNEIPLLYENSEKEQKKIDHYRKGASKIGKPKEHLIEEILEELLKSRKEIINLYVEAEKKSKILEELLPLKINKEIQEKLNAIEEENDLVLLSKFNILINENLKNEPSNFIYEKIGTKFHHFFFDEFQDTSKMQWSNIVPLRDHTISSDGSTFTIVGDPKQSIYRFRGGDSELMLDILNHKEEIPVKIHVEVLENNWRSAKNIVNFNNELYDYISQSLNEEHQDLFSDKAKQIAKKTFSGRVKVDLSPLSLRKDEFHECIVEQMYVNIQECLNNGYNLSDITILCRDGKEIQALVQQLSSKKVMYQGNTIYIKTISEKGLTLDLSYTLKALINFLKWEIQPKNKQYLAKALYWLNLLGKIRMEDFTLELEEILKNESPTNIRKQLKNKYSLILNKSEVQNLSLFNYIEYYLHRFIVPEKETNYILNFLELLYNYSQNSNSTIKDFIKYWDEEAHETSIQASENIDAIKIMTIHAAKGLEFPIVFLAMRNKHKDEQFNEWYPLSEGGELKSINIKNFKKELVTYDPTISDFNTSHSYKNKIERLCVQYVATTRAVEQLFLYIEEPKKSENKLELYDFISLKKPADKMTFDLYPEVNGSFRKQNFKKEPHDVFKTFEWHPPHTPEPQANNIAIATPSKNYQSTNESVRAGIFVHEILEKIHSEKDVQLVLKQYIVQGIVTQEEGQAILKRIENVIKNDSYKIYFEEKTDVLIEKEIMISTNEGTSLYRPDRIINTSKGLVIIDFKTGAENEKYEKQIEQYREALEKIGKTIHHTEIIYL